MKAFLWESIEEATTHYHKAGGVLIEAESVDRARAIALKKDGTYMVGVEAEPDAIFESSSTTEKVWVFPDAGCC